jgi:hypothetical protein
MSPKNENNYYLWILEISREAQVEEGEEGPIQTFNVPDERSPFHAQAEQDLPIKRKQIFY